MVVCQINSSLFKEMLSYLEKKIWGEDFYPYIQTNVYED